MIHQLTFTTGDWRQSPDYARAQDLLQRAQWAEASALLTNLLQDYPGDGDLESLVGETQLRLETEQAQRSLRRRRLALPRGRAMFVPVLIGVLAALAFLALNLYRLVITPAMQQSQLEAVEKSLASDAQQALAVGDYDRSLAIYAQLTSLNPQYPKLDEGRSQAERAKQAAELYDLALSQMAAGSLTDAQGTLIKLQQVVPNYRDVPTQLQRIERQQRYNGLVNQAVAAVGAQNWEEVVSRLEEARALSSPADRMQIDADLFDAYLNLGAQVVAGSGGRNSEMQRALEIYNRALALRPQEPQATLQRDYTRAYLNGYAAVKTADWDTAVQALEPLYTEQPGYLGGEAARMLYNAYMRSGDDYYSRADTESLTIAWERYFRASQMQGVDTSTARALAANLASRAGPTPTARPISTGTAVPLVMRATPSAPNAGQDYVPLARLKGKIVYRSTRGGTAELWVMDADGKNPTLLKDQSKGREEYQKLREVESRAPNGQRQAYVTTTGNDRYPQVYIARSDSTATRITDLAGLSADPVWSPKGYWIAFVSNQPGNDELFVVGSDGQGLKRLTNNTFEWDKQPSWSPDGARLVFWSNRDSGHPQIWVMNEDGTAQVNLSNNEFDERNPLWIK